MHAAIADGPRWGDFKALQARFPGAFGRTRAYELLAEGKLRAKKLGNRTIWDFQAAEDLIESLPDLGEAA
ncbi:hypothetical protein [Novosphingobium mangrovi (ex Huang et al. 2023)]|uniref:Excisionase n=1 Tax=Novosphingobium mangrovi (ex Huang et al. 2023) TaxID=2976432 RepID=A0ABT2I991_9SPHN|nr:hypothetical protein [Novosphingobium mangrovi (ex Huang et al. 2023)]MCT2401377.1 hypothetical protein [Novosphingobium mangrovi (ex Huang et al. 2023)]